MKYPKNHPLWPVYDLQRKILERGGKIHRAADLLAYFEGRSLVPDSTPQDILLRLAVNNGKVLSANCEKTKDLIDVEFLMYRVTPDKSWLNTQRIKPKGIKELIATKVIPNPLFSHNIPDYLKNEKEKSEKGYLLNDNEFILRRNGHTQIVILNPDYIDILRLILNGYNHKPSNHKPQKMKKNKNLLPAIILATGLILSAFIYAYANRYEVGKGSYVVDKWTSVYYRLTEAK